MGCRFLQASGELGFTYTFTGENANANGSDYVENRCFAAKNLLSLVVLLCSLYLL